MAKATRSAAAQTDTEVLKNNPTQNSDKPIKPTHAETVVHNLQLRTVDRSPKDRGTLRSAHIAGESVYWPNSSRLFDTYEDVLLDAHLRGIIRKRIAQVVNKRLLALRNGEEDPELSKLIKKKVFKDIMRQIIWTRMWGVNGMEFMPAKDLRFKLIPKKHIKLKTQMITIEQTGLNEGYDYTQLSNVWVLGEEYDLGELLVASYIIMLKKGMISDWAQFIEIYGSPIMVLKYKGYDQQAKIAADNILNKLASSARITIPEEMGLTFEDGKISNGDGKLQETFRQACNEELDIWILGNTETTGHGKNGTGAKSEVHAKQQLEIIKDDMDYIVDCLNSDEFLNILRSYGYNVDGIEFEFSKEVDMEYLGQFFPLVLQAINAGLPVTKSFMYETLGIPEPKDGEEIFQPAMPRQPEPDGDEAPAPAPKKAAPKKKPEPTAAMEPLSNGAIEQLNKMLDEKLTAFFGPARS